MKLLNDKLIQKLHARVSHSPTVMRFSTLTYERKHSITKETLNVLTKKLPQGIFHRAGD